VTKDLPDDPKELIKLCQKLHKDFQNLTSKKETALKEAITLLPYTEDLTPDNWAELMNILWDRHQIGGPPVFGKVSYPASNPKTGVSNYRPSEYAHFLQFSLSDIAGLPEHVLEDMFTIQEILVIKHIAELRKEAWQVYDRVESIVTWAALQDIKLPDDCIEPLEDNTLLGGHHWDVPQRLPEPSPDEPS
jgi:hypothetical protein